MSILAELLTKVKQPQARREVPPNLQSIIQSSAKKTMHTRKVLFITAAIAACTVLGLSMVYFMNSFRDMSNSSISSTGQEIMTGADTVMVQAVPGEKGDEHREGKSGSVLESETHPSQDPVLLPQSSNEPDKVAVHDVKAGEIHTGNVTSNPEHEIIAVPDIPGAPETNQVQDDGHQPSALQDGSIDRSQKNTYLYRARGHEIQGDYMSALDQYGKVLAVDRMNYRVLNSIGYIHLQVGNMETAQVYFRNALDIKRDFVPALINLGITHAKSGGTTAAETYLYQAIQLEPHSETAMLNLAILHESQKNYREAGKYYDQLMKLENGAGYLGIARNHERHGNLAEAVKLYRRVQYLDSIDEEKRIEARKRIVALGNQTKK